MYTTKFGKLVDIAKETKRSVTIYIKIRDLFDYESTMSKEQLASIPTILCIKPFSCHNITAQIDY